MKLSKWWIGIGVAFGGCCLPLSLVGGVAWNRSGIGPALSAASDNEAAYRAAGLPWVAKDMAPEAVADRENAAIPVLKILESAPTKSFPAGSSSRLALRGDPGAMKALREWDPVLNRLEAPVRLPKYQTKRDYDLGPNVLFPEFAQIKSAVRALSVRARIRAGKGDLDGALRDLDTGVRLTKHLVSERFLIGALVDIACRAILLSEVEKLAGDRPSDVAWLQKLRKVIAPLATPIDFERTLWGEAYMGVALWRNVEKVPLSNKGLEDMGLNYPRGASLRRDGWPRNQVSQAMLSYHLGFWGKTAPMLRELRGDPIQQGRVLDNLARAEERKASRYNLPAIMMTLLLPVFSQAGDACVTQDARFAVTDELLRLMADRARGVPLPKGLTREDPFGGKLRIVTQLGGFRVYSVGADLVDNGGRVLSEVRERTSETRRMMDVAASFPAVEPKTPARPPASSGKSGGPPLGLPTG